MAEPTVDPTAVDGSPLPVCVLRGALGGALMGLANLVPGISGGTMLLASGIYPSFIRAIAEVTTFRFRFRSLLLLAAVAGAAAAAILLLAGDIKMLVVDYRWIMYSLFIGLTLGGAPMIWRMAGRGSPAFWTGAAMGLAVMMALAWSQAGRGGGGAGESQPGLLFAAGLAGASAMILPGVSGGYLLLVLGQYVPILSAIDGFKDALQAGAWGAAAEIGIGVGIPVALGVGVGIVGVSNGLKILLERSPRITLGVLFGLLLGAVAGLWPFQRGVPPELGAVVKGREITAERLADMDPEDYPTAYFRPTAVQAGCAVALILAGFAGTALVSRLGGNEARPARAGAEVEGPADPASA